MEWYAKLYQVVLKGHEPYLVKRKHAVTTSGGYEKDLNFQDWTSPKYPPSANVHEAPESRCDPRATQQREQVRRYAEGQMQIQTFYSGSLTDQEIISKRSTILEKKLESHGSVENTNGVVFQIVPNCT